MSRFPDLQNKAVLITGGASGIGEALVRAFHREGARVGFLDLDRARGKNSLPNLAPA